MKKLKILSVLLIMLLSSITTSAKVYTSDSENIKNVYYVAGNKNFFPMEYYNYTTNSYEGVIPELLKTISGKSGVDFVYLSSDESAEQLVKSGKADMISAYVKGSASDSISKTVTAFEYEYENQTLVISFGFPQNADEKLVGMVQKVMDSVSEQEISGYLVSSSLAKPDNSLRYAIFITIMAMGLVLIAVMLWFKYIGLKKQMYINVMTDADTGLDNLLSFEHKFENEITENYRSSYYIAYLILDPNHFRALKDDSFKDVVRHTASILKNEIKKDEIAARITENGFVVCFHSTDDVGAKVKMGKLLAKLASYISDDRAVNKVFYVALYHLKSLDKNSELLLFNLRRNCSKIVGGTENLIVCNEELMNSEIAEKRLIDSVANAIEEKQFKLYLQFIVDNKTKKIVSAEALSRWHHPSGKVLTPGSYIESMEAASLIDTHDFYMFDMVCRQLHKWHNTEFGGITVSCNFTRITLAESNFADKIKEISDRYVFEKSKLIIEITEDTIEKNKDAITKNILLCKNMGFRVALDDMGSGYTSLVNLCEYPIDIVKIDRDILLKTNKQSGKDLFFGMVALSHNLGLKVVCEGVETEEQNEFASMSECDYIQGFYYSKVHYSEECVKFLKDYEHGIKQEVDK